MKERKRCATGCLVELKQAGISGLDMIKKCPGEKRPAHEGGSSKEHTSSKEEGKSEEKLKSGAEYGRKTGHVMISYCQKRSPIVHKIWKRMKEENIPIWIDVERLGAGDLDENLAQAIDGANLIVSCFSEEYQKSAYCRQEFCYSQREGKKIIPIRVQPNYLAQSWLAFKMGDLFYYDITNDEKLDAAIDQLIADVKTALKELPNEGSGETKKKAEPGVSSSHAESTPKMVPSGGLRGLKIQEVEKWLIENKLQDLLERFNTFIFF